MKRRVLATMLAVLCGALAAGGSLAQLRLLALVVGLLLFGWAVHA